MMLSKAVNSEFQNGLTANQDKPPKDDKYGTQDK
uniref:Uncharacterized protein n=1 Tax=Anguilla anguilla TaxID=7936 RepID=A0A0E9V1M0_ANGAN